MLRGNSSAEICLGNSSFFSSFLVNLNITEPKSKITSPSNSLFFCFFFIPLCPEWPTQHGPINSSFSSVQFSSVAQLCPTLCDPMDCSTPGFPVHHQLPKSLHFQPLQENRAFQVPATRWTPKGGAKYSIHLPYPWVDAMVF